MGRKRTPLESAMSLGAITPFQILFQAHVTPELDGHVIETFSHHHRMDGSRNRDVCFGQRRPKENWRENASRTAVSGLV
jgi:hypothetical protein